MMRRNCIVIGLIVVAIALQPSHLFASGKHEPKVTSCGKIATTMLQSGQQEAWSAYWLAVAKCYNISDAKEREAGLKEARADLQNNLELAKAQFEARKEICESLGCGPYNPVIDPENFVEDINNPYLTLTPGTTFIYEKITGSETERVEVNVTDETEVIFGVTCVVVHDMATINGELTEDTIDWYAQDKDGNVWYFGEISEQFVDGDLAGLEGSWKAGVDGALPGVVMKAHPEVDDLYRQEFALGVAEDMSRVVSLDESVIVPCPPGSFNHCLKTEDFTPISPDAMEYKYFSPEVGQVVLTIDAETGSREELIQIIK